MQSVCNLPVCNLQGAFSMNTATTRSLSGIRAILTSLALAIAVFGGAAAHAQGTAFTYQGELRSSGQVVNGTVDLRFGLWAHPSSPLLGIGTPQIVPNVSVVDGVFTVTLDFGASAFTGPNRWLEIQVTSPANGGSGPWTTLSPRQQVMPAPYAMHAISATSAGTLAAGTYGNAVSFTNAANSFAGSGAGLTNLNASNISSGALSLSGSSTSNIIRGQNSSTANNSHGVRGQSTSATGSTYGVHGLSSSSAGRGVYGEAGSFTGETTGVMGASFSPDGRGVYGINTALTGNARGVYGLTSSTSGRGVYGRASSDTGNNAGVYGVSNSTTGRGVYGDNSTPTGENAGVMGHSFSTSGSGVYGLNTQFSGLTNGVRGSASSTSGRGVYGEATSATGNTTGVYGTSASSTGRGLFGVNTSASGNTFGVYGVAESGTGTGVFGQATGATGISYGVQGWSASTSGRGVYGQVTAASGTNYAGMFENSSTGGRGVYALSTATSGSTRGVIGHVSSPSGYAAYFTGADGSSNYFQRKVGIGTTNPQDMLHVNGATRTNVIHIMGGADLAERFDVATIEDIVSEPGMVVCIDPRNPGKLIPSTRAYDRTVAGVISGANGINSGMIMGQEGTEADGSLPVALTGRVYVMVDAHDGAIEPGDLLTTSDTPGHAMKALDRDRRDGAVIGKAMTHLSEGERGLVLVLVSLQ